MMPTKVNDIDIVGFSGMNNVKAKEGLFASEGIAEPRIILNSDVDQTGGVLAREGYTKVVSATKGNSLWAGLMCSLFVDNGVLYRFTPPTAVSIGTVRNGGENLDYVEVEEKVYFSNEFCSGSFDPATNTMSSWGIATPPGPMLLSGSGNLPPGVYNVTMTSSSGDEISGTGPINAITLEVDGGIQVLNRPTGAEVWCTDANEYIFYRVGATNKIESISTVEPCPSLMCCPPPLLSNLCYAFGRIWGSVGSTVYYGQEFKRRNLFNLSSQKFQFESEVTVIAKVSTGLFIGMKDKTRFLEGTEPTQMRQIDAGVGSVKGTLAYCNNVPYLADIMGTQEKGYVDVPVWVTAEGIVVGNGNGRLFNLTKNRLRFGTPVKGASLYRNQNGVFQFLSSFKQGVTGSGAGFSDEATCEVFRNGVLVPAD